MLDNRRIGIIFPPSAGYVHDVVKGIASVIRSHRSWSLRVAGGIDHMTSRLLAWKPDGVIANIYNDKIEADIKKLGVPVVNFSGGYDRDSFPTVKLDDEAIGAMAAEHLLNLNLKHFAFWENHKTQYTRGRQKGFDAALRQNGITSECLHTMSIPQSVDWKQRDRMVSDWLRELPKPIGLFTSNDSHAYFISDLAREANLDIPNEIALLGADDDSLICDLTYPPLSSLRMPGKQVGIRAAQLLIHLLEGGKAPTDPIKLPPIDVIERGSTDMLAIENPDIANAVRYIRKNAVKGITVPDVLRFTPMSRRSFESQFKQIFSRSPGTEIRRVQLAHAKKMLLDENTSIAEVSVRSGFCDPEYLARVFRKKVGMTALQYRRQYQNIK